MSSVSAAEPSNLKDVQQRKLDSNYAEDLGRGGDIHRTVRRYQVLSHLNALNAADEIRFNVSYHAEEKKAVDRVMNDFGPLYVPLKSAGSDVQTSLRPWAGYWYPYNAIESLYGPGSPLQKFDEVLEKSGRSGSASRFEATRFSETRSDLWEGNCLAWALAASYFSEPQGDREFKGRVFSAPDRKALMMRAIDRAERKVYGIPYRGDLSTDGTFQDIRPEAFHQLAVSLLKSGRAPVIDDDAGTEVWSKPVFRYQWRIEADPQLKNAVIVTAFAHMVRERREITLAATGEKDVILVKYVYRLYLDLQDHRGEGFSVVAGEWIGESRSAHPDTVTVLPPGVGLRSSNEVLNQNLDLVKSIIAN